jgi:hypothetical protein
MPSRVFSASDGAEWRVWSVIPGRRESDERRRGYDRRSPDPVLRHSGPERRTGSDRRARSALLDEDLRGGWLVFQSSSERRRLAPIPPGWERLSVAALERLRDRAATPSS